MSEAVRTHLLTRSRDVSRRRRLWLDAPWLPAMRNLADSEQPNPCTSYQSELRSPGIPNEPGELDMTGSHLGRPEHRTSIWRRHDDRQHLPATCTERAD